MLALGFSGGGDSTALLHALRAVAPERPLLALIVDHGLRPNSADEAAAAAETAERLGAQARVLTWATPRPGQDAARAARHVLLAEACRDAGASVLCLGHTLDDRIETLRMRQTRQGGWRTLTGMAAYDGSPAWPEGRDLVLARPFLSVRRRALRAYLTDAGASWIEDPSNQDPRYERVRWRAQPLTEGGAQERALLAFSDAALRLDRLVRRAAFRVLDASADIADWGGVRLDQDQFAEAPLVMRRAVLEAVVLAVSGQARLPAAEPLRRLSAALCAGRAATGAGVLLTANGWIGRDPGAAAGRVDAPGAAALMLGSGGSGVFDGRWAVTADAPVIIRALGAAPVPPGIDLGAVPAVLRPGLAVCVAPDDAGRDPGAILAAPGVDGTAPAGFEALTGLRVRRHLLPPEVPTWFDAMERAARERVGLANQAATSNIEGRD